MLNSVANHSNECFIKNAGLVILHPFFISFFENLEIFEDGNWKDQNSQDRALLLSQYLVTGEEEVNMNELILNKILLGLPLNKEVNLKLNISALEKEICQELLHSLISHWGVLKNTSIEGLRDAFLIRYGRLSVKNIHSYELYVEENEVDILLAQLPWGIGTIKTPLMKYILLCNW